MPPVPPRRGTTARRPRSPSQHRLPESARTPSPRQVPSTWAPSRRRSPSASSSRRPGLGASRDRRLFVDGFVMWPVLFGVLSRTAALEAHGRRFGLMMTRQIEGIQMDGTRLRYLRTLLVGLALVAGVVRVDAYPTYEDTGQGGCQSCHPRFFDDPGSP